MHELTESMILTALGDWQDFAEFSAPIKLAVNVPASALVQLPIPRMLREARPRASNWPGLILEVTEDQIINDLDLANDVAGALRELKCELAVDDFGAGYSSLVRLKQLPFSELKIDRSTSPTAMKTISTQVCVKQSSNLAVVSACARSPKASKLRAEAISSSRSAARSGRATCLRSQCPRAISSAACARA